MTERILIEGSNTDDEDWDMHAEALSEIMEKKKPSGEWEASVANFGWRGIGGTKPRFTAKNGEELLLKILPQTDCNFRIFNYGKRGIKINNVHHDSPMWGKEWYYILPACMREGFERDWEKKGNPCSSNLGRMLEKVV